ncbi:unnamed protein product [Arctogadus glacialis]
MGEIEKRTYIIEMRREFRQWALCCDVMSQNSSIPSPAATLATAQQCGPRPRRIDHARRSSPAHVLTHSKPHPEPS